MEMINNRNYMTSTSNGDNHPLSQPTTPNSVDQYARTMANENLGSGTRYMSGIDPSTGLNNPQLNWSRGHPVPVNVLPGAPASGGGGGGGGGSGYSNQNTQQNFQQQTQNVYQQQHQYNQGHQPPPNGQGPPSTLDGTGTGITVGVIGTAILLGGACWWWMKK